MTREPYIINTEEIQSLINGLLSWGPEETYVKIRAKMIFDMENKNDIDEMALDMSETLLKKGREELKQETEDNPSLANVYYTLSSILRRLAHEIHWRYINKKGDSRSNDRFLRLVSNNTDAPLMT
jgi:hypothetical protein